MVNGAFLRKSSLVILGLSVCCLAFGWRWLEFSGVPDSEVPPESLHTALTNAVAAVRNRVTGGIGILIARDPASGRMKVQAVLPGSPSEQAGLRPGDFILGVNGSTVTGRPLAEVVSQVRGFSGGSLKLLVGRTGTTNREFVLERASWNELEAVRRPNP